MRYKLERENGELEVNHEKEARHQEPVGGGNNNLEIKSVLESLGTIVITSASTKKKHPQKTRTSKKKKWKRQVVGRKVKSGQSKLLDFE